MKSGKSLLLPILLMAAGAAGAVLSMRMDAPAIIPVICVMLLIYGLIELLPGLSGNAGAHNSALYAPLDAEDERPQAAEPEQSGEGENGFCPYCGAPVSDGFAYCRKCGKKLPD